MEQSKEEHYSLSIESGELSESEDKEIELADTTSVSQVKVLSKAVQETFYSTLLFGNGKEKRFFF